MPELSLDLQFKEYNIGKTFKMLTIFQSVQEEY